MAEFVFRSMARIGKFKEIHAGQTAPAYEGGKVVGNPVVPKELDPLISNPSNSEAMLWWITGLGEVSRQIDSGGEFELRMVSDISGFDFICRFDPLNKGVIKVKSSHYDDLDFSYSVSLELFVYLLNYSTLDVFKFLKDNVSMNAFLEKQVEGYIQRLEGKK